MVLARAQKFQELATRKKKPQPQITKSQFLPPSQGGLNTVDGAANTPPQDALRLINLIPQQYGTAVRKGYVEWCEPIPLGDGVKTIIPFTSKTESTDSSKLFAVTSDGIYDITDTGVAPTKVFDWSVKSANTGWCSWHNYQTLAGDFILLCDLENGYHIYTASTDTWAASPALVASDPVTYPTPPAPEDFDFVTVWKHRVWLVEKDTGTGWFMEVGTITGDITPFYFGNKFKHGGHLKGLYNWTMDGGEGVDDYLTAVSQGGDVLLYKGTDPNTTDFNMQGSFWLGTMPKGRRIGGEHGGDLLLLSSYGLVQMSKLINGLPLTDENLSLSHKINIRLNQFMSATLDDFGWEVKSHPQSQLILIATPKQTGQPQMQFVYNTITKAWSQFHGLPMLTGETWNGKFYLGDEDNHVYTYEGYIDNVMLEDDGDSATSIEWESFTSFQAYGAPAIFKRVQMLRPQFIGGSIPSYIIAPRYDFDVSTLPGSPSYIAPSGGLWDTGIWGTDVWGGGYIASQPPVGAFGVGRHVAIQMRGRSSTELTHVGTDVLYDLGGML